MHPLLKDRRSLSLYLFVWLALSVLLAALLAFPGKVSILSAILFSTPLMLIYAFMSLSAWYVCRAFPLPSTNIVRLLGATAAAATLSSIVWTCIGIGWALALEAVQPGFAPTEWARDSLPLLASAGIVLFLLASAVNYLITTFESARATERTALELRVLARESELKALRAQLDPHFLFNSLNSISALTATDPPSARAMTVKLAEFLRASMMYGALETITVEQEMSLVSRFLDIEKVRFGNRLTIETRLDDSAKSCRIAPLLLQPIVENAVGHGIACLVNGGNIRVTGTCVGGRLQITVENPVDPGRRKNTGTGVGLQNVRQRLQGLYGTDGRIDTADDAAHFSATLSFPAVR